ncbi:PREDICTED: uncharacterized protein LOC106123851 [Papilio xuthus]|uniref:Uncharacterized protein LOC106123851 n=1 Tax=Papilio xuthus TaxID=66420 RepID=A0AAJ6ZMQ4_PAPXU|nr:PREDICTED: uncharacterized protein LOC106123851 [Papilio xuthus]
MSTEATKDWILCRSYRFPNKFYYFNIHNGESKWARPDKKTLLTSDKSKDNCKKPNTNLNSEIEPNIEPDDVVGLLGCRGLDNNFELNCNKSLKQDNQKSQTFLTNEKSFPLHSQIHTATITKENKQKFLQQQKKKFNKTLVENHRCFSPPLLNDTEGIYAVNTLNGIKIGQKSFRMYNKPGYNRQRKVIWDPYIKLHSSDSQSEDLTKNALSSITNKMEDINLLSTSSNVMTGENDCDNFIVQHDKKWFIFRDDPQNEEMIKFQTFGRNSSHNDMGKTSKRNMATMKHETKDTCFIVIDLNVLLNDFQFVNDKVIKDTRYRLVIPNAVISKLRNLAEMDHKSHQLMLTAQNLIWKIPTQSRHIILEPEQQITPKQQIISCCKKIKNLDYNLDVKEGLCSQLFNDCNIRNEQKDINNNLFLQKPEDIEPLNFSHLTSDVNENYPFFDGFDYEKAGLKETVYEKLKKYSLRNRQIANLIILRAEDYMCTFTQIMETFMSDLLLNENVSCDFCTIPQAVDAVAQLYPDSTSIQIVAYRMSALYNLINQKNKLETKYKADILIKMVGCGMILVESIKAFKPNSEILLETEYLLGKLLQSIEDPNRFENELEQSKIVRTNDTSLILKEKDITPENRREIFDKAYKTYHRMSLVVDNLTNILNREKESNTTVITLLEQAGVDVANDKLISKYK